MHTTSNSQLWDVYGQGVKCKHSSLPPPPLPPELQACLPLCAQSLQPIIDTHLSSEISQVGTIKTSTTHIQHFEWTWTTFYSLQIYFIRVIMKNQQVYKLTPLRLWAVHRCGREPSLSDILYASGFVVHFYHLTPAHPPLAPFGQWTKLISNRQRWEDGARSILYCVCVIFTN